MSRDKKRAAGEIIFVTGTDTGVGKTVLTALLIHHLRQQGVHVLGMKPFACASQADSQMLRAAQSNELTIREISPFYFPQPVAPLIAVQKSGCKISKGEVIKQILHLREQAEILVVEGCGGLLVPLAKDYAVADLIAELDCLVVVVGRNKLGTLNHTLLTARVLSGIGRKDFKVVLMNQSRGDISSTTNRRILAQLLGKPVIEFPFLGRNIKGFGRLEKSYQKVKKTLARILK